jgi:hypothetical protein
MIDSDTLRCAAFHRRCFPSLSPVHPQPPEVAAAQHEEEPSCGCFGTSPPKSPPGSPRGPRRDHPEQSNSAAVDAASKPKRLNRSFSSMFVAEGAVAIVHACVMLSDGSVVTTTEGTDLKVWSGSGAPIHGLHVRTRADTPFLIFLS